MNNPIDIMDQFFKGKLGQQQIEYLKAEIGNFKYIGSNGSYKDYVSRLELQSLQRKENPIIHIGKDIKEEGDNIFLDDSGIYKDNLSYSGEFFRGFVKGDNIVILVLFYNLLNETDIRLAWENDEGEILGYSNYTIPSAHSYGFSWYDLAGAYFYAPEMLKKENGNHSIDIEIIEQKPLNRVERQKLTNKKIMFSY